MVVNLFLLFVYFLYPLAPRQKHVYGRRSEPTIQVTLLLWLCIMQSLLFLIHMDLIRHDLKLLGCLLLCTYNVHLTSHNSSLINDSSVHTLIVIDGGCREILHVAQLRSLLY